MSSLIAEVVPYTDLSPDLLRKCPLLLERVGIRADAPLPCRDFQLLGEAKFAKVNLQSNTGYNDRYGRGNRHVPKEIIRRVKNPALSLMARQGVSDDKGWVPPGGTGHERDNALNISAPYRLTDSVDPRTAFMRQVRHAADND